MDRIAYLLAIVLTSLAFLLCEIAIEDVRVDAKMQEQFARINTKINAAIIASHRNDFSIGATCVSYDSDGEFEWFVWRTSKGRTTRPSQYSFTVDSAGHFISDR